MGMMPRTRRVRIAGVYALGLYEFDAAYGFVSLEFAQRLLGKAAPDVELRRPEGGTFRLGEASSAPALRHRQGVASSPTTGKCAHTCWFQSASALPRNPKIACLKSPTVNNVRTFVASSRATAKALRRKAFAAQ